MAHVFVLTKTDTHDSVDWSGSDSVSRKAILEVLMTMPRFSSPYLEGVRRCRSFDRSTANLRRISGGVGSVKPTSPIKVMERKKELVSLWANMRLWKRCRNAPQKKLFVHLDDVYPLWIMRALSTTICKKNCL